MKFCFDSDLAAVFLGKDIDLVRRTSASEHLIGLHAPAVSPKDFREELFEPGMPRADMLLATTLISIWLPTISAAKDAVQCMHMASTAAEAMRLSLRTFIR